MKKAMMITLCLLLGILVNTSFAAEVNVFGPKQYVRTNGSPDVYPDTFTGLFTDIVNTGKLVIENGDLDDKHRVTSALVYVNGVQIFQPKDFKQKIYLMEAAIDLTESNTLEVEIRSKPGTYLTIRVIQDFDPPTVTIHANPDAIKVNENSILTWSSLLADTCDIEPDIGPVAVNGSMTVSPNKTTTYTITATGPGGMASAQVLVTVEPGVEPQPEGSFGEQYEDLIPSDATIEAYDPKRLSLITGLVQDKGEEPIAGVSVTILNHLEYGSALTDIEGRFSIPVEGGGSITVVYQKDGFLTVQRKVYVPWNDIAIARTIEMIPEDPLSTTLTFDGNPNTVVTHQSAKVTDQFGSRSATVVFTGNNQAYEVDAEGNIIQELTTITTRATEYTTPDSMPAILPPNSAYTYCVELSVYGVQRVRFDQPVIIWVDNFLGFDVGEIVPMGYYDRDRGVWVPFENGVVVKLLDTDGDGKIDALDSSGDNQPDDLNNNGNTNDEVTGLEDTQRYPVGSSFWRVAVSHFTPVDFNWPYGPPADVIAPNPAWIPEADQQKDLQRDCRVRTGSFVEERSRVFHDDIPIPGTDMTLHYASNRVKGYKTNIIVPASGETVPTSLKRINVEVEIAGQIFSHVLDPLPNQTVEIIWNGLDHLGRQVDRPTRANVRVGFVYDAVYWIPGDFDPSFGMPGLQPTGVPAREETTLWQRSVVKIAGSIDTIADGWSLSAHHFVSPMDTSTLHKGDGTTSQHNLTLIDTVAGNGTSGYSGDNGPATEAQMNYPNQLTVDAEGNIYFSDVYNHRIRKIDTEGIITTVAQFAGVNGIAVDAEGNLYVGEAARYRVRKVEVDLEGNIIAISTVAGNGTSGYSGDGGPATEARLNHPEGIAVDASGNLYIADINNYRVRKVDTSGIITTVAGNGTPGYSGDEGPAIEAKISLICSVAMDIDGNLYIADSGNNRIRKVDTSGIITTVAGNGIWGYSGDGGPATEAMIDHPRHLTVDAVGNIYFSTMSMRVRKVDTNGIIMTLAGNGTPGYSGDGGPAVEAQLHYPIGVGVDAMGQIYIADALNLRIRMVGLPSVLMTDSMTPGDIAFGEENGLGHIMSGSGSHKTTIDLNTGNILREFDYNENKRLISITDRFGNQISLNRDGDGKPTAIISPDGITTELAIDENDHLTRITYPDGSYYSFEYTTDGLMTAKIEPENNRFEHQFDDRGRLTDATDEEGGHRHYDRTVEENGDISTEVTTGEGNITSYLDHTYSTGAYESTITDPTGAQTLFTQSADGLTVNKFLPCGMDLAFKYDVDSEYKFKVVKDMRESTPSGLERVTLRNKAYQDTNSNDVPDLITETVKVNGKATILENNILQSQKTITSPEGRTVTTFYHPATLVITSLTIPGLYETTYGYDSRGRLTSISTNTRGTSFTYNSQGFLESITDPEGYTTTYTYDPVGRIISINRPDTTSIGFTYDKNGNMTVLTNPSIIDHEFGYNLVNLNDAYYTPLSGSYRYVYDKDRRLKRTTFPSGDQIDNIYNKTRLTQIQTPEGNIDFTYLCGTKVRSISNGTETITYGYDGKLVTSETLTGTLNHTLRYTYNKDFNLRRFTYAGDTVNYAYDNDGLLTGAGSFSISRNTGNGLPESVTGGALNLSRTFNGYGEVDSQDFTVSGQSLTSWDLTRDNNGRIIQKIETVDGVTSNYVYTYDPIGRLKTVTKDGELIEEYQYNLNGTRTYEMNKLKGISGRILTYSNEDHLLTAGSASYQYDLNGFLTTKTDGTDVTNYDYSIRGELLTVDLPDGTSIEYAHDPLGRRIAKKVNGLITEKYLWQGLTRLLAVYDDSDNLLMRFEYADGRMPVSMTRSDGTYYFTCDQVGSLRVVSDSSGNAVKVIDYDSFGDIINDTDPSFEVPFGFAGGLHDRDTGLVRFGYRDYDPDVGRWTAKDPILFAGGDTDLYGYCIFDPVNWIDPGGLFFGINAGETYGEYAAQYYANITVDPCVPAWKKAGAWVGGLLSSLWTPETSEKTFLTLAAAYLLDKATRNLIVEGPKGTRKFQARDKRTGKPYFRIDKGPVPGKGERWHYHRRPDLGKHRPHEGW